MSNIIIFQAKNDNQIPSIENQIKKLGISNVKIVDSNYNGHIDEYGVEPNKERAIYIDCAKNVSMHGFHTEVYDPPIKTDNPEENKRLIAKAKEHLEREDLSVCLEDDKLEPITREFYLQKLEALEEAKKEDLWELSLGELGKLINVSKTYREIILYGMIMYTRIYGRPISKRGFEYDYSLDFLLEEESFNKYPDQHKKWIKAIKTRLRTIIKEEKNFNSIKFFVSDFLVGRHEEELAIMQSESESNMEEPIREHHNIPEIDIDIDEIPFAPIGLQYPMILYSC